MNSPFLLAQARALVRSDERRDSVRSASEILYRRVYARDPSDAELESALAYVNNSTSTEPPDDVVSAWHYGYGTLDLGRQARAGVPSHFRSSSISGGAG